MVSFLEEKRENKTKQTEIKMVYEKGDFGNCKKCGIHMLSFERGNKCEDCIREEFEKQINGEDNEKE